MLACKFIFISLFPPPPPTRTHARPLAARRLPTFQSRFNHVSSFFVFTSLYFFTVFLQYAKMSSCSTCSFSPALHCNPVRSTPALPSELVCAGIHCRGHHGGDCELGRSRKRTTLPAQGQGAGTPAVGMLPWHSEHRKSPLPPCTLSRLRHVHPAPPPPPAPAPFPAARRHLQPPTHPPSRARIGFVH